MRLIRLRVFLAILAFATCAFVAPSALAQDIQPPSAAPVGVFSPVPDAEEIQAFSSHVTVMKDGTIDVVEQVDYYFSQPKHGIYRDIPVRFNVGGKIVEMSVTVTSVHTPEEIPWPYAVERNRDSIRIKIGDPSSTLEGAQSYVISYSVSGALRYFADHDELYWNVTGNGWTVPIRKSAAEVSLPESVAKKAVTARCYTGAVGSTAQDCLGRVEGNGASFVANGPLTVVVGWNKGAVQTLLPKEIGFFERYGSFLPLVLPLSVLMGLVAMWNKNGRDPKGRGTIVVQYEPPAGLSPVEVGAVCREDVRNKDLSSIIVHLAIRGYLRIVEVEKKGLLSSRDDYEFQRLKECAEDKSLQPFETHVLRTLFDGDTKTVRVSEIAEQHSFYKEMEPIKAQVFDTLVADGYFPASPSKVRGAYYAIGIAVLFGIFFFLGPAVAFSGTVFGNLILAAAISALFVMFFAHLMPRRTPRGVVAYEFAIGFKEYLSTAEKYRMQWQEKENIFEKFLPYAMVFGVVDKWSKTFEGMNLPSPQWYRGSAMNSGIFNSMAFSGAVNSMDSAISSAMISAPASSSGGSGFSGGFSGGGGGGGGGGSW